MTAVANIDIQGRYGTARGLVRLMLGHAERLVGGLAPYEAVEWDRVERLVFVCTGNICRSPYAEYRAAGLGLRVSSFGLDTQAGLPAFDVAMECAAARGLDLAGHGARKASEFDIRKGDLLIAMEPRQVHAMTPRFADRPCQITLLGLWSRPRRPHIHDPYGLSAGYMDTCFGVIDTAVQTLAERMRR